MEKKTSTEIAQESYELYWTNPGVSSPTNQQLFGHRPPISKIIRIREQNMRVTSEK